LFLCMTHNAHAKSFRLTASERPLNIINLIIRRNKFQNLRGMQFPVRSLNLLISNLGSGSLDVIGHCHAAARRPASGMSIDDTLPVGSPFLLNSFMSRPPSCGKPDLAQALSNRSLR